MFLGILSYYNSKHWSNHKTTADFYRFFSLFMCVTISP